MKAFLEALFVGVCIALTSACIWLILHLEDLFSQPVP